MASKGDDRTAQVDAAPETAADKVEVVRYNGFHFERREFTSADLAHLGYPDRDPIVWEKENNWTVRRSVLGFMEPDVFERVVLGDGKFSVETIGG